MQFTSQANQDKFILHILQNKKRGYFLELGSSDPIFLSNTYSLEKYFNWTGIMVEYDETFKSKYEIHRPNSIHILQDANTVDYLAVLKDNNYPKNMDYLQIDLEVNDGSTLKSLIKLDNEILNEYKFAVVTFEHDIYRCENKPTVRELSRNIFEKQGYIPVLKDVSNIYNPFEDWYVHPDLVNMDLVQSFIAKNLNKYIPHHITGKMLEASDIEW